MMNRSSKFAIALLRIVVGWFFLYQGISRILNTSWLISSSIHGSEVFPDFYKILLEHQNALYLSYAIKGLLVLIGLALMLGLFTRLAAFLGILVTLLFYFPLLKFPYIDGSYIVNEQIIIVAVLILLITIRAGEFFGLGSRFKLSRY